MELTVTVACQSLLIPPSPIIIPKNSASGSEYLGNTTFFRWLFFGYFRVSTSAILTSYHRTSAKYKFCNRPRRLLISRQACPVANFVLLLGRHLQCLQV